MRWKQAHKKEISRQPNHQNGWAVEQIPSDKYIYIHIAYTSLIPFCSFLSIFALHRSLYVKQKKEEVSNYSFEQKAHPNPVLKSIIWYAHHAIYTYQYPPFPHPNLNHTM